MHDKRCGGRRRGSGSRKGAIRLVRGSVGEARETERSQKKRETKRQQVAGGRESGRRGRREGWRGGGCGRGVSAEEVWMSVSCHETWEVLPALIRVSEEHKEQGRLF